MRPFAAKDIMNLETTTKTRSKLSLQFGRMKQSPNKRPACEIGVLSAQELQRIVSQMVG
jgi:hypothetical protein